MAKKVTSSDLFHSVAFDRPVTAPDGHGGTETRWSDPDAQVKARAHILYLRGGETVQAARLQGRQPVVVTIRRSTATLAISVSWRMRDVREGVAYQIRAIVPTDDRQFLEITAESGVAV